MLFWDFFKKFLLFARSGSVVRRIAWLTIIGLSISIGALILVMSVMTALNHNQRDRTLAIEPHLTVEVAEAKSLKSLENSPVTFKARAISGARVFLFESQDVILRTMDGKFRGAVARGVDWQSLKRTLSDIRNLNKNKREVTDPDRPGPREVLIGVDLAHSLGVFEGESLMVVPPEGLLLPPSEAPKYEKVRVGKILSTNLQDIDSQMMFYIEGESLTSLGDSLGRRNGLEIRLPNPDDADFYKAQLGDFNGIKVETWRDRNSALFFALRLEKIMIGIFLSMAALVAGLSLISVVSLLISQKTKEIGLLQALGFSRKKMTELFSRLGFTLAVFGIGGGFIVGTGVSFYLQAYPLNVLPDIYYDSQIPAEVDPVFILVICLSALVLAFFAARFSAKSAASVDISHALRGKN
jgi:lipoprotein-releasing system permease protein